MIIELEGAKVIAEDTTVYWTDIKPGETYIAKRNMGWKLLTCREVVYGANRCSCDGNLYCEHHPDKGHPSYIHPQETAYSYDSWESYKVIDIQ
jgi:hypothetical protein